MKCASLLEVGVCERSTRDGGGRPANRCYAPPPPPPPLHHPAPPELGHLTKHTSLWRSSQAPGSDSVGLFASCLLTTMTAFKFYRPVLSSRACFSELVSIFL